MPEINGQTYETRCYVDGHWGQYGASRVLRIADDILGTTFWDDAAAELADHDPADPYSSPLPTEGCMTDELPSCEIVSDAADDAETALNDATPTGYMWHWYEGDFFLSSWCDDDDTCDDETCVCHCYCY